MNESRLQQLVNRTKIGFLQWRITCARKKLDKCQPHTPEIRGALSRRETGNACGAA
jgi:hypothetical protein